MSLHEPNDSADLTGNVITVPDIEVLQASVFPWQLDMRQVSRGTMDAQLHIGQVGDILVTREFWSRGVVASGTTPSGYLALAGTGSEKSIKWCGHEIDSRRILCGLDSAEIDFATPESEDHWVFLIPQELLVDYLGEREVEALRGRRGLSCGPNLSGRLLALANRAISPSRGRNGPGLHRLSTQALRSDLLDAVARLVTGDPGNQNPPNPQSHYQVCCRAIAYSRTLRKATNVSELCSAVNVKRRTLERALRENLGITPHQLMHLHRLNRLHRNLRAANPGETTVTTLMLEWGFSELGRTAVEYKRLFGQLPSATLAGGTSSPGLRLVDALADAPRQ
jgi:AraC family ethanolamine operon transcriptional activator